MTRVTVLIESFNKTDALVAGRATSDVKGFANQHRIIIAGSKAFKAAIECHRKERRDQRVLHGVRV